MARFVNTKCAANGPVIFFFNCQLALTKNFVNTGPGPGFTESSYARIICERELQPFLMRYTSLAKAISQLQKSGTNEMLSEFGHRILFARNMDEGSKLA